MSFQGIKAEELYEADHEILASDFCSGYTDVFGKWNTGFECPRVSTGKVVYCCGSPTYKYCCTRTDEESLYLGGMREKVIMGSICGVILLVLLVAMISYMSCKKCQQYRRSHLSYNGGPLYSLHYSSTNTGMAQLYAFTPPITADTALEETQRITGTTEEILNVDTYDNHQDFPLPCCEDSSTSCHVFGRRNNYFERRMPGTSNSNSYCPLYSMSSSPAKCSSPTSSKTDSLYNWSTKF